MHIQNNIRALREARGMTQLVLAEQLGIKGSTDRISMWERGFMYPHLKNFLKLLEIFQCSADDIYPKKEVSS